MASPYLHQKVRRPIPPPFHHLIPSSSTLPSNSLDDPTTIEQPSSDLIHQDLHEVLMAEGEVTEYTPPTNRHPPLYTITYLPPNPVSTYTTHPSPYYTEQITTDELEIALAAATKRHSSTQATPSITIPETRKSVYYRAIMERRGEMGVVVELGHGLVWRLCLVAGVELEWEERVRGVVGGLVDGLGEDGDGGSGGGDGGSGVIPKYYRSHPTSYLGGAYRPPATNGNNSSGDPTATYEKKMNKKEQMEYDKRRYQGEVIFAPNTLGARVRLGIQRAHDYYTRSILPNTTSKGGRRRRRLESEVEEEAAAGGGGGVGRGRRSSRLKGSGDGVNYAEDHGGAELLPRATQQGGAVALFLLKSLGFEVDGSSVKTNTDNTNTDDDDDDGENKKMREDYDPNGPAGEILSTLVPLSSHHDDATTPSPESDNEEEEEDVEMINPFFQPRPSTIFHRLTGKQSRATSPAEIQTGICYAMEDSIRCMDVLGLDLWDPLQSLLGDDDKKKKKKSSRKSKSKGDDVEERRSLTLVCTSGDSLKDLPDFEPQSFSRCRFRLSSFVPALDTPNQSNNNNIIDDDATDTDHSDNEDDEDRRQEEEEDRQRQIQLAVEAELLAVERHKQEEKKWRLRKRYEIWRFGGVQGGYAVWPDWKEFVMGKLEMEDCERRRQVLASASVSLVQRGVEEEGVKKYVGGGGGEGGTEATTATVVTTTITTEGDKSSVDNNIIVSSSVNPSPASGTIVPPTNTDTSESTTTVNIPLPTENKETQEANDAALARSLGGEDTTTALATNNNNNNNETTQRRSRRATNNDPTNTNSNSHTNLIFYGSNQSLTATQLLSAIHRLILQSYPRPMTLIDLKRLVMEDGNGSSRRSDAGGGGGGLMGGGVSLGEWRKVRVILGKLMFRLGKVERVLVDCVESDEGCWSRIGGRDDFLVTFEGEVLEEEMEMVKPDLDGGVLTTIYPGDDDIAVTDTTMKTEEDGDKTKVPSVPKQEHQGGGEAMEIVKDTEETVNATATKKDEKGDETKVPPAPKQENQGGGEVMGVVKDAKEAKKDKEEGTCIQEDNDDDVKMEETVPAKSTIVKDLNDTKKEEDGTGKEEEDNGNDVKMEEIVTVNNTTVKEVEGTKKNKEEEESTGTEEGDDDDNVKMEEIVTVKNTIVNDAEVTKKKEEEGTGKEEDDDDDNGKMEEVDTHKSTTTIKTIEPHPIINHQEKEERQLLQVYVRSLHTVELTLRTLLLQHYQNSSSSSNNLQQITPNLLSTAADELEKENDAMDRSDFLPTKSDSENDDNNETEVENGATITKPMTTSDVAVTWKTTPSHPLLGKVLYRPHAVDGDDHRSADVSSMSCVWYRVVSYCPSVLYDNTSSDPEASVSDPNDGTTDASSSTTACSGMRENQIVRRRIRFRAVRTSSSARDINPNLVDEHSSKTTTMDNDDDSESEEGNPAIILTEGQVQSGIYAGNVRRSLQQKGSNGSKLARSSRRQTEEEGDDGDSLAVGMRVLLNLLEEDGKVSRIDYAWIVGRDESYVHGDNDGGGKERTIQRRVLLLLDIDSNEDDEQQDQQDREATSKPTAFWAKISPSDSTLLTSLPITTTPLQYRIELQQYHPTSPAYVACESILSNLKSHVKSVPFLEPVDPVELGIPEYLTIVQNPMDLSTVEGKLTRGHYGRIPLPSTTNNDTDDDDDDNGGGRGGGAFGRTGDYASPIGKMLHGPFMEDVLLVFDNAILFNPKDDWIHQDASQLRRLVVKKIETLSHRAERDFEFRSSLGSLDSEYSPSGGGGGRGRKKKKSVYVDEDSDADVYTYESDMDDYSESGGRNSGRKRKRRVGGGKSSSSSSISRMEDFATRAVEYPTIVPGLDEWGSSGVGGMEVLSHLPIATDARIFCLPAEWSCRKRSMMTAVASSSQPMDAKKDEEAERREKILSLQTKLDYEQQSSSGGGSLRRSARSHVTTSSNDGGDGGSGEFQNSAELEQVVEYYLKHHGPITIPLEGEEGNDDDPATSSSKSTVAHTRSQVESVRESLHEEYFAKLHHKFCHVDKNAMTTTVTTGTTSAGISSKSTTTKMIPPYSNGDGISYGTYMDNTFPPFLGRIVPAGWSPTSTTSDDNDNDNGSFRQNNQDPSSPVVDSSNITWEIRAPYILPAIHWVLRGLIASGHLERLESSIPDNSAINNSSQSGGNIIGDGLNTAIVITNHAYYCKNNDNSNDINDSNNNNRCRRPYDVLDVKEMVRRKRFEKSERLGQKEEEEEEEVELSAYEKMREERVARNKERLKLLGLG